MAAATATAQLALTVVATGLWVDFAKDVVLFSPHNDVVKIFDLWCMTRLARRSRRASSTPPPSSVSGLVVARGYERTFERDPTPMAAIVALHARARSERAVRAPVPARPPASVLAPACSACLESPCFPSITSPAAACTLTLGSSADDDTCAIA